MDFYYAQNIQGPKMDAYEKVLIDCIEGDQMLFWRQDSVELSWAFLTPILGACEVCQDRSDRLHPYRAGSWGPEAVNQLNRYWTEEFTV
jgi:glucose-6-phosphate 1-dehydrogenase